MWKQPQQHHLKNNQQPDMRRITQMFLIIGLALAIILISIYQPERFSGSKYDVHVINGFTKNSSLPLVIWCSSNGEDFGGRALQEGDDFSWSLKTSLWDTTRFLCTIKWDQEKRKFDAFKVPRDVYRCRLFKKCFWMVREDGFYFSNDEVNWKKDFTWF